jgi:hypothetical protein
MNAEDSLRDLLGYGEPVLHFMGQDFALRPDGLVPLLRYARAVPQAQEDSGEAESRILAASHRLLEDCIEDFAAFTATAFTGKAQMDDITGAVAGLASHYCARSHWAAMRLMDYAATHLEELDGQLLRVGGSGMVHLSAREACNLALAVLLDGRNEEDRAIFMEDLNYEGNPEAEALAMVRQMQAAKRAAKEAAEG